MSRLTKLCWLVLALGWVGSVRPAAAGDKYAGEFLKIGVGARALGMGGAFVGLSDDATAAYWNPAGIGFDTRNEAFLSHSEEFGQVENYDTGALVHPLGKGESIGISVIRLSLDNIPTTDGLDTTSTGTPIYDEGRLVYTSDEETALLLSYGKATSTKLNLGATVKLIHQSVADHTSFGLGADVGFIFSPDPSFSLGVAVDDITGTFLSWDTGLREHITPSARIGAQTTRAFGKDHLLTITGDLDLTFDGRKTVSQFASGQVGGDFHFGGEYWFHRTLALRAGYNAGNFTAGAGGHRGRFSLDYAYISNATADLSNTQRISGSVEF